MQRVAVRSGVMLIALLMAAHLRAQDHLRVDSGGHLFRYGKRALVLVGDSGTQCVMQDLNLDYRRWIDDCSKAGLTAVHVWSFVAPRQHKDATVIEKRYGYVFPGVTPWRRRSSGPLAHDGERQWDLREFDEGNDPAQQYWPRLRDLCRYAAHKKMLVGITVFFGWPKHQSDWAYHPLNAANGGHLTDRRPIVEAVQQIASPGKEIFEQLWSKDWSDPQKTQWIWERFAAKLIADTRSFGNVFFVFMDERSYSEGNCGDHFAAFFRRRGAIWIDGQVRRAHVDAVVGGQGGGRNINREARRSFTQTPLRPFLEFELPSYRGAEVRRNLYACLLGGGHYFFHDDQDQETTTTGVMAYDPLVKNADHVAVRERLRWLGIACQLMNEGLHQRSGMVPCSQVIQNGKGYCLGRPGQEYVVYIHTGKNITLQLDAAARQFHWTLICPQSGEKVPANVTTVGNKMALELPDSHDWLIHGVRVESREVSGER